jgi:hypothetical protein
MMEFRPGERWRAAMRRISAINDFSGKGTT